MAAWQAGCRTGNGRDPSFRAGRSRSGVRDGDMAGLGIGGGNNSLIGTPDIDEE